MPIWDDWYERLEEVKLRNGASDAEISAVVSETGRNAVRQQVNHFFNGRRDPTLKQFFAMCLAVGADPGEILFKKPVLAKPPKPLIPPKTPASKTVK